MIQLTRNGLVFSGSAGDLRKLRAEFRRKHYVILPKLIERDLLAVVLKRLEAAATVPMEHDGIIKQTVIDDPLAFNLLVFLLSIPEFQRLVQRITGCRRIADFQGRIYRLNPATDERIVWHTDVDDHRMVTFSLNLTPQEYRGGTLQIRRRDSRKILHEVRNTGLGDALLMRVARKLSHRVLPVEGNIPRTAMAGWFRWEKENVGFHQSLRDASNVSTTASAANEKKRIGAERLRS